MPEAGGCIQSTGVYITSAVWRLFIYVKWLTDRGVAYKRMAKAEFITLAVGQDRVYYFWLSVKTEFITLVVG